MSKEYSFTSKLLNDEKNSQIVISYDEYFFQNEVKCDKLINPLESEETKRVIQGLEPHPCINFTNKPIKFEIDEYDGNYKCYGLGLDDNILISKHLYDYFDEEDKEKLELFLAEAQKFLNSLFLNRIFDNKEKFESLSVDKHKPSAVFLENARKMNWEETLVYSNSEGNNPATTEIYEISKEKNSFFYYVFTDLIDQEIVVLYDDEIEEEISHMFYKRDENKSKLSKVLISLVFFVLIVFFIIFTYKKGDENKELEDMRRYTIVKEMYFKTENFHDCYENASLKLQILKSQLQKEEKDKLLEESWTQKKQTVFIKNAKLQVEKYRTLSNFQNNVFEETPQIVTNKYFEEFKRATKTCYELKKLNLELPILYDAKDDGSLSKLDNKVSILFEKEIDKNIKNQELQKAVRNYLSLVIYEYKNIEHYLDDIKISIDSYKDFINIFSLNQKEYLEKLIELIKKEDTFLDYKKEFYKNKYISYLEELKGSNMNTSYLKKNEERKKFYESSK